MGPLAPTVYFVYSIWIVLAASRLVAPGFNGLNDPASTLRVDVLCSVSPYPEWSFLKSQASNSGCWISPLPSRTHRNQEGWGLRAGATVPCEMEFQWIPGYLQLALTWARSLISFEWGKEVVEEWTRTFWNPQRLCQDEQWPSYPRGKTRCDPKASYSISLCLGFLAYKSIIVPTSQGGYKKQGKNTYRLLNTLNFLVPVLWPSWDTCRFIKNDLSLIKK